MPTRFERLRLDRSSNRPHYYIIICTLNMLTRGNHKTDSYTAVIKYVSRARFVTRSTVVIFAATFPLWRENNPNLDSAVPGEIVRRENVVSKTSTTYDCGNLSFVQSNGSSQIRILKLPLRHRLINVLIIVSRR